MRKFTRPFSANKTENIDLEISPRSQQQSWRPRLRKPLCALLRINIHHCHPKFNKIEIVQDIHKKNPKYIELLCGAEKYGTRTFLFFAHYQFLVRTAQSSVPLDYAKLSLGSFLYGLLLTLWKVKGSFCVRNWRIFSSLYFLKLRKLLGSSRGAFKELGNLNWSWDISIWRRTVYRVSFELWVIFLRTPLCFEEFVLD